MHKLFKNLMLNTASFLCEGEGEHKTAVQLAREAIAKNTIVVVKSEKEKEVEASTPPEKEVEKEDEGDDDGEEDESNDDKGDEGEEEVEETEEQKAAKAAEAEKAEKESRKQDRIQKRIDKAVAAQRTAEARVAALEAQLAANPDKTLTEEEVQKRAETIAKEKITANEVAALQKEFDAACDKLQSAGTKLDPQFTPKVIDMANELGPIPSRVIGILSDLDNGAKVLKFMVDDIDEAEKIYDLKDRPEKLAIALVRLSDKIAEADKPRPRKISNVPNPVESPRGSRIKTNEITGKESTDEYIRKRQSQMEERRKQRGY